MMAKVTYLDGGILVESDPIKEICIGVYDCQRCGIAYAVNRPDTWKPCTPEFCHDCYEHLSGLYYIEPLNTIIN